MGRVGQEGGAVLGESAASARLKESSSFPRWAALRAVLGNIQKIPNSQQFSLLGHVSTVAWGVSPPH